MPFTDEQAEALSEATTAQKREALVRKWRQEYKKQTPNDEGEDEGGRIEELKAKILELDPKAIFRNPSIKSLEERLQKLGGGKENNETSDEDQTDSDQGDSTDDVEGAE